MQKYSQIDYSANRYKVYRIPNHECILPLKDDPVSFKINEGCCVEWRRKFLKLFVASPENPESRIFFKSTAQIMREQERQIIRYMYMIHPMSSARIIWEDIMMIIYFLQLIWIPIDGAIPLAGPTIIVGKFIMDLFTVADIIITFFTGVVIQKKHKVEFSKKFIAKKYIKSFFIFDMLSAVPVTFIMALTRVYFLMWFKYMYIAKLPRILTFTKYLKKLSARRNWNCYKVQFFTSLARFLIIFAWLTAFRFVIFENILKGIDFNEEYFKKTRSVYKPFLNMAYSVVKSMCLAGIESVYKLNMTQNFCIITEIMTGIIMNLIIIAEMYQVYKQKIAFKHKYERSMQQLSAFTKYQGLNRSLQRKIHDYVAFKYQKTIVRESEFLGTLSASLKKEILLHNCEKLIAQIHLFKNTPPAVMAEIVMKLRVEIYLPGDVIFYAGSGGTSMYFISIGTVAVYYKNEIEVAHWEDGDHFGELSLMFNLPRSSTIKALKTCEVLKLTKKDFLEIMENNSELFEQMQQRSLEKYFSMVETLKEAFPDLAETADSFYTSISTSSKNEPSNI